MSAGHLYAIRFSNDCIKVGRSTEPAVRIGQHKARVAVAGIEIVESITRYCAGDVAVAERTLIARCKALAAGQKSKEWFFGLDFAAVAKMVDEAAQLAPREVERESRLYIRRDCMGLLDAPGYICRSCCRYHPGQDGASAFICRQCGPRGYTFAGGALYLRGEAVPMWSGIEPGTEVRGYDAVSCEELRPELPWLRVPDERWILGRPVLDYAGAAPEHPAPAEPVAQS